VDGLTTNLLLDDHRQLGGWGHVPLGGTEARPSLGGAGGLTTHTGRGSVGSNVLTMHMVSYMCCRDWLAWGCLRSQRTNCPPAWMLDMLPTGHVCITGLRFAVAVQCIVDAHACLLLVMLSVHSRPTLHLLSAWVD
jgi:hypothetical protein